MKKVLKSLVPLGIVFGVVNMHSVSIVLLYKSIGVEEIGQLHMKCGAFTFIVFIISYFLTALVIKDKKYIVWFLVLYGTFSLIPLFLGMAKVAHAIFFLIYAIQYSLYAVFFYLGFNWIEKNKQMKELEKQNLQSELALLKNQINPHFLFNTLNNIDSLIKSNPDHASKSLLELSGIMRYMLYETNADRVSLQKEMDYINDYLKLQKIQYANAQLVDYTVSGNSEGITVAPMLFIPFIENAFKHCTDKEKVHAIRFLMTISKQQIYFEANNIVDPNHSISKDSTSGVGLETVKRRLAILYPNKHSLQISEENNLFCVQLNIKVDD